MDELMRLSLVHHRYGLRQHEMLSLLAALKVPIHTLGKTRWVLRSDITKRGLQVVGLE